MTRDVKSLTIPAVAAAANFASVLVGLWAISRFATGGAQLALLNLWAVWGIALGLLGNAGLLSATLDGQRWYRRRNIAVGTTGAILTGLMLLPLSTHLLNSKISWAVLAAVSVGVTYLLGRQRGALAAARRGAVALVVTAAENVLRAMLVLGVLLADQAALGALAICAPLLVSLVIFAILVRRESPSIDGKPTPGHRPVAVGLLAGTPAVLAYGIVPVLTLLDYTDELDQVALAATLLRGPVVLAGFLAPWLLEQISELNTRAWRVIMLGGFVVALCQALIGFALEANGSVALISSAAAAAVCAVGAYVLVTVRPQGLRRSPGPIGVVALAVSLLVLIVLRGQPSSLTFLPVAAGSLIIAAFVDAGEGIASAGRTVSQSVRTSDSATPEVGEWAA